MPTEKVSFVGFFSAVRVLAGSPALLLFSNA